MTTPKQRLDHEAERLREREAAARQEADARVDAAAETLDELTNRSAEAEASYQADTAARRKALADDVDKKLPRRG